MLPQAFSVCLLLRWIGKRPPSIISPFDSKLWVSDWKEQKRKNRVSCECSRAYTDRCVNSNFTCQRTEVQQKLPCVSSKRTFRNCDMQCRLDEIQGRKRKKPFLDIIFCFGEWIPASCHFYHCYVSMDIYRRKIISVRSGHTFWPCWKPFYRCKPAQCYRTYRLVRHGKIAHSNFVHHSSVWR